MKYDMTKQNELIIFLYFELNLSVIYQTRMSCNSMSYLWNMELVTITCVNFNQVILERNWMLSEALVFINVANIASFLCFILFQSLKTSFLIGFFCIV